MAEPDFSYKTMTIEHYCRVLDPLCQVSNLGSVCRLQGAGIPEPLKRLGGGLNPDTRRDWGWLKVSMSLDMQGRIISAIPKATLHSTSFMTRLYDATRPPGCLQTHSLGTPCPIQSRNAQGVPGV